MRSIAHVLVVGAVMVLFHRLAAAGPLEARATLALGFLLLVGFLGGELAKRVKLPRITGYLLLGFFVGPAWLSLVRADEVAALRFIGDAGIALIAFAAGRELRIEALQGQRIALWRLTAGTTLLPLAIVAAGTLAVSSWLPITAHQGLGDAVAVALVLGTLAAAASPAVTMALMDERGAHGPFARLILGVTVAKDVVAIVLLSVVLAIGRPLTSDGALQLSVAWIIVARLVAALGVGVLLGVLVAQYLHIVRRHTPLHLVAVGFVTALVGTLLEVEPLLIALAAGFYLENVSRAEAERLTRALHQVPGPVYIVVFALAGAGLHLDALRELWPWILLLVGLRVVALRAGARWAGQTTAVMPDLARYGWLGLISQAGVALSLATAARRAFPEWGVSLESLIVAMIGVHELAGPVCFRIALGRVGELKEKLDASDSTHAVDHDAVSTGGGML